MPALPKGNAPKSRSEKRTTQSGVSHLTQPAGRPVQDADYKAVRKAILESEAVADAHGLLSAIMENFDGYDQFARLLVGEFNAAPAGGMARQRILDMVGRLVTYTTTVGLNHMKEPSDMTQSELEEMAVYYARRANEVKDDSRAAPVPA